MRKVFPIFILILGCSAITTQAADISRFDSGNQGIWNDYTKFIVISDCNANVSDGFPHDGTENTPITARSFYPANSLNVLKKALYALEAHPSDLPENSLAV